MFRKLFRIVFGVAVFMAGAVTAFRLFVRPRILNWGVTPDEAKMPMPGDDLLDNPGEPSTHAVTLDARPTAVWPWLVQMGCTRAGWYSHDRLDNGGKPSAHEILPAYQQLSAGDLVPSTPDGKMSFTVRQVDPPHALVLGSPVHTATRKPFESPGMAGDSTWAFLLVPQEDGRTRLYVRARGERQPRTPFHLLVGSFWDLAHFIMQRKQLEGIQERVESSVRQP